MVKVEVKRAEKEAPDHYHQGRRNDHKNELPSFALMMSMAETQLGRKGSLSWHLMLVRGTPIALLALLPPKSTGPAWDFPRAEPTT